MMDFLIALLGIAAGGAITYFVTTRYMHRPTISYFLKPAAYLEQHEFGKSLEIKIRGNKVSNLAVFNLEISLHGKADLIESQVLEDQKPTLFIPGFRAFDVQTLNNDETRFEIPLGIAAGGSMIICNIKRIRAGTTAVFQLIGAFDDPATDINTVLAEFYPGALINVDTNTSGSIKRPWKKEK